jgi:hypothetical protein
MRTNLRHLSLLQSLGLSLLLGLLALPLLTLTGCAEKQGPITVVHHNSDVGEPAMGNAKAILICFADKSNEVYQKNKPVLEAAAEQLKDISWYTVNPLQETQWNGVSAIAQHYDVHNFPTLVLRKAGEVYWFKHVGPLTETELKDWIAQCMSRPATLADQSPAK